MAITAIDSVPRIIRGTHTHTHIQAHTMRYLVDSSSSALPFPVVFPNRKRSMSSFYVLFVSREDVAARTNSRPCSR